MCITVSKEFLLYLRSGSHVKFWWYFQPLSGPHFLVISEYVPVLQCHRTWFANLLHRYKTISELE